MNDIQYLLWYYMYIKIYAICTIYMVHFPVNIPINCNTHLSFCKNTNLEIYFGFGYHCGGPNLILCCISPLHLGLGKFLVTFMFIVWNIYSSFKKFKKCLSTCICNLRRLDGKEINHQLFHQFSDTMCLVTCVNHHYKWRKIQIF